MIMSLLAAAVLSVGSATAAVTEYLAVIEIVDGHILRPVDSIDFAFNHRKYAGQRIKISRCRLGHAGVGGAICVYRYSLSSQAKFISLDRKHLPPDDFQRVVRECPSDQDLPPCWVILTGTIEYNNLLMMRDPVIEWPSGI